MDAGQLATLVRLYDNQSVASSVDDSQTQSRENSERAAKAYKIIATAARENDGLKTALREALQRERAVGRSAYSTEVSFHSLVQAIFWALATPQESQEGEKLRAAMFVNTLQLLHALNAASAAQRCAPLLLEELHNLRVGDLAAAVSEILRGVQQSQRSQHKGDALAVFYTVELLPQLLLRVSSSMSLSFEASQCDGEIGELSGPQYRQRVLEKLADLPWPRRFFLQVLKNFRDFTLMQDEERTFCIKVYREARKELNSASDQVRTREIFPTVCLSVLQLVGRTNNVLCTRLLTRLLVSKCQQLSVKDAEGIREIELSDRELRGLQSTVLYHFDMALRQWERLGDAIRVEYEQRSLQRLSTFDISLVLLVASNHKCKQPMMQLLIRHVVDTYAAKHRTGSDGHQEALSRKAFLTVAQNAQDGSWTPIVHQMIELGFLVVEHRGNKNDLGGDMQKHSATVRNLCAQNTPDWVDFGVRVLLACFQYHLSVRERILDRIVNMIIVQDVNCATYIHVMSRIVSRHIAELSGALERRIRECLEYVTQLDPEHAHQLLVALSPLLKIQHSLKEFVILVLRKAMFRKDEDSRIIGIQGFALLLCLSSRIFSRSRSLSQLYSQNVTMLSQGMGAPSSMHHSSAVDMDIASQEHQHAIAAEDLYRQFSGIFRKGLQLQTRVRAVLYAELVKVFTECPALQESILKLVFQHYQKFYEFNETVQPPLKLDLSISRKHGVYEEPLQYLMHTMFHCYLEMKRDMNDSDEEDTMMDDIPATQAVGSNQVVDVMDQNFSILFERLKRCDLSDFEFDKNATFSSDSELGESNQRLGRLVMGIAQVAINWSTSQAHVESNPDSTSMSHIWESLLRYAHIFMWLKRKVQSSEDTQKQFQSAKKRKLTKVMVKHDSGRPIKSSASSAIAEGEHLSLSFENSAHLQWATLLTPDNLLRILAFATAKASSENGNPCLTGEEEDFVLLTAHESMKVLELVQRKVDAEKRIDAAISRHRGSLTGAQRFHKNDFTRQLCSHFLKLLRVYCCEEVSLLLPKGSTAKKRMSGENAMSQERMRNVVRTAVHGFAWIVDIWSHQSVEEFGEQMTRMVCLNTDDENSPDYDIAGEEADSVSCVLLPLRKLIDDLLQQEMPDEANRILDVVQIVCSKMSMGSSSCDGALSQHIEWVKELLCVRSDQASPRLLEKYITLLLRPSSNGSFQYDMAKQLAQGLRYLCNSKDDNSDESAADISKPAIHFRRLSEKNVLIVANAILAKIDDSLSETEQHVKVYDSEQRRHSLKFKDEDLNALQQLEDETGSQVFRTETDVGQSSRFGLFKRLCRQSFDIAGAIRPFVEMSLKNVTASIRIVRLAGRLYKVLVLLLRDKQRRKDASLPKFLRQLFDRTAGDLSPALLRFIACIQDESSKSEQKERSSSTKISKSTASKSNKFIPDVIFQLEQFDFVMIKLSKLCRGQDFNTWCKLRASRDFRLNKEKIKQALGDQSLKKRETNDARQGDASEREYDNEGGIGRVTAGLNPSATDVDEDADQPDDDDTQSAEEDTVTFDDQSLSGKKRHINEIGEDEVEDDTEEGEETDEIDEELDEEPAPTNSVLAENEI